MGFGDSSLFLKISFVITLVSFVAIVLGVGLPYWYYKDFGNFYQYYGGLWRHCVETDFIDYKQCNYSIDGPYDWWKATQALEVIGLVFVLAALVVVIIVLFAKNNRTLKLVYWILCFCACGFIIIGVAIYGAKAEHQFAKFSGAFGVTIVAGILILVAGILGLLDWIGK